MIRENHDLIARVLYKSILFMVLWKMTCTRAVKFWLLGTQIQTRATNTWTLTRNLLDSDSTQDMQVSDSRKRGLVATLVSSVDRWIWSCLFSVCFVHCSQRELSPSSLGSIANCRSLQHLALSATELNDDALGMVSIDNFSHLTRNMMVLR